MKEICQARCEGERAEAVSAGQEAADEAEEAPYQEGAEGEAESQGGEDEGDHQNSGH